MTVRSSRRGIELCPVALKGNVADTFSEPVRTIRAGRVLAADTPRLLSLPTAKSPN
jgi:hypothetical protein